MILALLKVLNHLQPQQLQEAWRRFTRQEPGAFLQPFAALIVAGLQGQPKQPAQPPLPKTFKARMKLTRQSIRLITNRSKGLFKSANLQQSFKVVFTGVMGKLGQGGAGVLQGIFGKDWALVKGVFQQ